MVYRVLSICVLVFAILLGLPHFPWLQVNRALGESSMDTMEEQYKAVAEQHPLPPIQKFQARDGSLLGVRVYRATEKSGDNNYEYAILHHGAASDSSTEHPLAVLLQERGIHVLVPDIRGHGESITGRPGDLDYLFQNHDDMEDMMQHFHLPKISTYFVGHSAQGGAAWHLASLPKWRDKLAGFVAISPFMGLSSELIHTEKKDSFAHANIPRALALIILNLMGITVWNNQYVMRYYINPANDVNDYDFQNSYNMAMSHAPLVALNYKNVIRDIPSNTRILSISGGADEGFKDRTPILKPLFPTGKHVTIPGGTHMSVLFDERVADCIHDFMFGHIESQ